MLKRDCIRTPRRPTPWRLLLQGYFAHMVANSIAQHGRGGRLTGFSAQCDSRCVMHGAVSIISATLARNSAGGRMFKACCAVRWQATLPLVASKEDKDGPCGACTDAQVTYDDAKAYETSNQGSEDFRYLINLVLFILLCNSGLRKTPRRPTWPPP